ncbi:hypothetical protein N7495_001327 [Penicillium taxi]|uniref:uncharacterized protein n=1 Tax=Penicillium taxi TaxID=168475 RepID=UPI0025452BF4|nr:uncharacterized protein N7495_001327 [Penicillium taxi]KAJ5908645.1 hypothetical protein N7495_001327 [Penicillium taxi]
MAEASTRRFLLNRTIQISIVLLLFLGGFASADVPNRIQSERYAHGFEGAFPLQRYYSAMISGPILNFWQQSPECQDGQYTVIAPHGDAVHHSGPMILDQDGHLIWYQENKQSFNADICTFKGDKYLSFWAGNDSFVGHGEGFGYLVNSHYEEKYKIHGANGLQMDLHEFHITSDDTALFTVYDKIPADLRETDGKEDGWIWDGAFQEVDVETNELLFQWHASDHFTFREVERGREGNGDSEDMAWDWFHINSVDKDEHGNFLISTRYLNCLAYIDGRTGKVLWRLGGKQSSFTDISGGAASNISWQHHGRFQRDYYTSTTRAISLFDNASRGEGAPENPSRGLIVDVNEKDMTVQVRMQYWHPERISSASQGSLQILKNGNVLLGYGNNAVWVEFTPNGQPLCEVNFGPRQGFNTRNIMSFRTHKSDWIGLPRTNPNVALSGTQVYVSWNGATEVATWVLQGSAGNYSSQEKTTVRQISKRDISRTGFEPITTVSKTGFETIILIPKDAQYSLLRVVALDGSGGFLGASSSLHWEPEKMKSELALFEGVGKGDDKDEEEEKEKEDDEQESANSGHHVSLPLVFGVAFLGVALIALCVWRFRRNLSYIIHRRDFSRGHSHRQNGEWWEAVNLNDELEELNELDELENLESEDRDDVILLRRSEHE